MPGLPAAEPVQSSRQVSAPSFKIILVSDTLILFIQLYAVLALFLPSIRAGNVDFRTMYTNGYMVRTYMAIRFMMPVRRRCFRMN